MAAAPMATKAKQPPSSSSSASTTTGTYPRWVLLDPQSNVKAAGSHTAADARTLATARTSAGNHVGISLQLTAPPAASSIIVYFTNDVVRCGSSVYAVHGDSVLIYIWTGDQYHYKTTDYFVYNAGAAAVVPPRPPSLSLLPPYYLTKQELEKEFTGLLRRGKDEIAVAELKIVPASNATRNRIEAELFLLRSSQWSVVRPVPVIHGNTQRLLLSSWTTYTVHPVGDAQLCWVDLYQGLLFCSIFDESPVLRHVPLTKEAREMEPLYGPGSSRNVCVTSGSTLKFVGVFPRCCCGGTGSTNCKHSHHSYTVYTWTLRMDSMVWVMDGMVDATELWALKAYKGIPRVPLLCPIVSVDSTHTICFLVCECVYVKDGGDKRGWLIMVDIRRKAILSVSRYAHGLLLTGIGELIPSRVSCYFDSNRCSSNSVSLSGEDHTDMIVTSPKVVVDDTYTNDAGTNDAGSSTRSSCNSSSKPSMIQLSVILAAFEEIKSYGWDRDIMLKAYSILSQQDGRRLRFLLGIPNNLRRDWLLMEIKATET